MNEFQDATAQEIESTGLDDAIERARVALLAHQREDGHWCFELESDGTSTAEYILMMHFMDEIDDALQESMARYLRTIQATQTHGGWSQYYGGAIDISCTVKAYYALKAAGDNPDAEHMRMAREAVLAHGGAAKANVFARILLAQFEQVPWRAIPYLPVEIMLLPRWAPFHIEKMSCLGRAVLVPLMVLCSLRVKAINPRHVTICELFVTPPALERHYFVRGGLLNRVFLALDRIGCVVDRFVPKTVRRRALHKAEAWLLQHLNGEDGIAGISPAMVLSYEAMATLGYPKDGPVRQNGLRAIQKLVSRRNDGSAHCQPAVSPVWDTAWSALALIHAHDDASTQTAIARACDWLATRQELECKGDWAACAPDVAPGGWAFQYSNAYYPDIDDTALVAALLCVQDRRCGESGRYRRNTDRAADWMIALQSKNGGFAAFDKDNTHYYLNAIPFSDHGAMLDPPTEDVSGRVAACLGVLARSKDRDSLHRCIDYLRATQQHDGSWWGRWGSNYIYGTWSVLAGLVLAGEDPKQPYIRKAIDWLRVHQHVDGGWGETNDSYIDPSLRGTNNTISTPHSTAWAVLAQLVTGDVRSESVRRGIAFLLADQQADGLWGHLSHNAPGVPRVLYFKYHGYAAYFPLWALARYRKLLRGFVLARG